MSISPDVLKDLADGIRLVLFLKYAVAPERIDVRTLVKADNDGRELLRIEIDLDGKTPPSAWGDDVAMVLRIANEAAKKLGLPAVDGDPIVSRGTTEEGK